MKKEDEVCLSHKLFYLMGKIDQQPPTPSKGQHSFQLIVRWDFNAATR